MKCPKCETVNPADSKFCKECATPLPPGIKEQVSFTRTLETTTDELTRGTLFAGRYEIIEELGEGGMGKVYRAHDTKLNEEVALKLIKPGIAADKRTVERFHNEIKIARKITHKNVCRTHDLGEEGKTLFLTMEYVRGEDLKSLIHRMKVLAVGSALSIARQVAEGLGEAHKLGITHRDLKPGNIMIDKDGQAKIMDFGIARSLLGGGITAEGGIIGTPEYMSPEQVDGKPADARADIYALGIILFEMVTGQVPFEGETPFSIANKQKSELPPVPKKLMPQIPEGLSRLILRCLEKDKAKRYQTADELIADIAVIEDALPTTERVATRRRTITHREVTIKFTPRKFLIPALALLAVVVAGILLWRPWLRKAAFPSAPAGKPSLAVLPFTNNTGDQSLDRWKIPLAEYLIDNLEQSKYIYVLPKERLRTLMKEFSLMEANGYSSEDLKKLAARGIGQHILVGSIFKSGRDWVVNVTLKKADTGEDEKGESAKGEGENLPLFAIANELTSKIKRALPLSGRQLADDAAAVLGNVTTSSPEAYAYFSQGFGFYSDMEYLKAIPLLERAVEIDPKFAMAWRTLAACYSNLNPDLTDKDYDKKASDYYKKAFELSEGLTLRERYLIQANYYTHVENNPDKALEILDKLLKDYPEDLLGNRMKSNILRFKQIDWKLAVELVEKNNRNFPENALECARLDMTLANSGELQRAEEVARNFLKSYPDNAVIRRYPWVIDICRGEFDLALSEWEETFKRFPASIPNRFWILSKGGLHMYRGDFDKAEQEYLKLARSEVPAEKIQGIYALASLSSLQGQFSKARKFYDEARELAAKTETKADDVDSNINFAYQSFMKDDAQETLKNADEALRIGANNLDKTKKFYILVFKGWAQARLKDFAEAEKTATQIKTIAGDERIIYWYHLLTGWIEIERGQFDKALPELERVSVLYPKYEIYYGGFLDDRAFFIYPLALAYYKAGDLNKAIAIYQEITLLTIGRRTFGDIYAKAFYMLGKIYEQKGEKAKAVENYRKFLSLWKDADPGLPEVEDARKRLASL